MKLKIKLFKQSKSFCGPASIKIVMDYYGIRKSEQEWANITCATKRSGCTPKQITSGIKKLGYRINNKINSTLKEVKNLIRNKIPVIIYWEPVKGYGHYSVLAGVDSSNVFIANPRKSKITKMSIDEFIEKWHDEFGKKGDQHEIIVIKKPNKTYRPSVFIVVYKINTKTKKPEYLILKRKLHWSGWEFPKGGIEYGETAMQTAKRETIEECGLMPLKIKAHNVRGKYRYPAILKDRPNNYGQTYELFSAEVKQGEKEKIIFDQKEHSSFIWLEFNDAIKKLTWRDQKKCLSIVNRSLIK